MGGGHGRRKARNSHCSNPLRTCSSRSRSTARWCGARRSDCRKGWPRRYWKEAFATRRGRAHSTVRCMQRARAQVPHRHVQPPPPLQGHWMADKNMLERSQGNEQAPSPPIPGRAPGRWQEEEGRVARSLQGRLDLQGAESMQGDHEHARAVSACPRLPVRPESRAGRRPRAPEAGREYPCRHPVFRNFSGPYGTANRGCRGRFRPVCTTHRRMAVTARAEAAGLHPWRRCPSRGCSRSPCWLVEWNAPR